MLLCYICLFFSIGSIWDFFLCFSMFLHMMVRDAIQALLFWTSLFLSFVLFFVVSLQDIALYGQTVSHFLGFLRSNLRSDSLCVYFRLVPLLLLPCTLFWVSWLFFVIDISFFLFHLYVVFRSSANLFHLIRIPSLMFGPGLVWLTAAKRRPSISIEGDQARYLATARWRPCY